jgi:homoserine kinase
MAEITHVKVRVPATAANLGPGFDCLGMTLDIWNEVKFTLSGDSLEIQIHGEGENQLPRDKSNLIYYVLSETLLSHSKIIPKGLKIYCDNNIPVSSGLGSSASAVLVGILAANSLFDLRLSDTEILNYAVGFEGHADNLAASLAGGLVLSYSTDSGYCWQKTGIPQINVIICLPDFQLSTQEARTALPDHYPKEDVIFNISRSSLLIFALINQKYELLRNAMQDRIHQPYRLSLIPGAEDAINMAYQNGAYGVALSGAGPGIIAIYEKEYTKIAESMKFAFQKKGLESRIIYTTAVNQPTQIEIKKAR